MILPHNKQESSMWQSFLLSPNSPLNRTVMTFSLLSYHTSGYMKLLSVIGLGEFPLSSIPTGFSRGNSTISYIYWIFQWEFPQSPIPTWFSRQEALCLWPPTKHGFVTRCCCLEALRGQPGVFIWENSSKTFLVINNHSMAMVITDKWLYGH